MYYNFCCWLVLVLYELFIQTASIICQSFTSVFQTYGYFCVFLGLVNPPFTMPSWILFLIYCCIVLIDALQYLAALEMILVMGTLMFFVHLLCHDHFLRFWWFCSLCFESLLHAFFVLTSQLLNTKECSKQGTTYNRKL